MVELETGQTFVATSREWLAGQPVEIFIRRRGYWTELDDRGEAIRRAGRPEAGTRPPLESRPRKA